MSLFTGILDKTSREYILMSCGCVKLLLISDLSGIQSPQVNCLGKQTSGLRAMLRNIYVIDMLRYSQLLRFLHPELNIYIKSLKYLSKWRRGSLRITTMKEDLY